MIRATTPRHTFIFENIDPSTFKELNIYYAQQGVEILKKTKNDCAFSEKETDSSINYFVIVRLTQEETKMFKARYPVKIQIRALTEDNDAIATEEYEIPVFNVINDEVLGDET